MKKTKTPFRAKAIGFLLALLIMQLISVPFWVFGGLKWGLSFSSFILFYCIVATALQGTYE